MAGTAGFCKPQNVNIISSPLNGGLMEQEFPVVVRVQDGINPPHQAFSDMYGPVGYRGTGGHA